MGKFFGDISEFLGFFIVFIFLLLRQLKKKPQRTEVEYDEEPLKAPHKESSPPLPLALKASQEPSLSERSLPIEEGDIHSKLQIHPVHGLPTDGGKNKHPIPSCVSRLKGRKLLLSYEILSPPLSLRAPRRDV
jgi:hypothetical protein